MERLIASRIKRKDIIIVKESPEKAGDLASEENYKELIGQGKVEKALSLLIKNEKSSEVLKDLILLSSQWQDAKRKENLQLETPEKLSVVKSQIIEGILDIVN